MTSDAEDLGARDVELLLLVDVDACLGTTGTHSDECATLEIHVAIGVDTIVVGTYSYQRSTTESQVATRVDAVVVG